MIYMSEVGEMYNILNVQNQIFIKNSYFLHTYLGCIKVTSALNQIYKNKKQEHAWLNLTKQFQETNTNTSFSNGHFNNLCWWQFCTSGKLQELCL